jgi:hypothetical protein
MPTYRLHIRGYLVVEFEEGKATPQTPEALQAYYEDLSVNPYDLDGLTLELIPETPEETAEWEAALQRRLEAIQAWKRERGIP